jgi:tripartite-type tricarboxylate transporter receptor subunit TctC
MPLGGQSITCAPQRVAGPQVQGGAGAYAIISAERNPAVPNVPTTKEAGLPEFQVSPGLPCLRRGVPQPIPDRLVEALDKALTTTTYEAIKIGDDIPGAKRGQQRSPHW